MFYDYICRECGYQEEINHSITEDPEIRCTKCNSIMKRIITGGCATHFKGNGWGGKNSGSDASRAKRVTQKARVVQDSGE